MDVSEVLLSSLEIAELELGSSTVVAVGASARGRWCGRVCDDGLENARLFGSGVHREVFGKFLRERGVGCRWCGDREHGARGTFLRLRGGWVVVSRRHDASEVVDMHELDRAMEFPVNAARSDVVVDVADSCDDLKRSLEPFVEDARLSPRASVVA